MLGLEYEFRRGGFLGVEYGGRHVIVQVSTFGVSPTLLQGHLGADAAAQAQESLRPLHDALLPLAVGGKQPVVLAGVDYLDRFKGVQVRNSAQFGAQFGAIL